MANTAGEFHYLPFYGSVTGLILSNFTVSIFTVDGDGVDAATSDSLELVELSGGYYYAKYTPSVAGKYVLALTNAIHVIHAVDVVDIDEKDAAVNLSQSYGGTNALKPVLPEELDTYKIQNFMLFVIPSSDWDVGRNTPFYAVASTGLDESGNWLATPLVVVPGTYHISIVDNTGVTYLVKSYLEAAV